MAIGMRMYEVVRKVVAKRGIMGPKKAIAGTEIVGLVIHVLVIVALEVGFKIKERKERKEFIHELDNQIEKLGQHDFIRRLEVRRKVICERVADILVADGMDKKEAERVAGEIFDGVGEAQHKT